MARHIVAAVSEMPPGARKCVTVEGKDVALFNVKGELFAVLDRCPHRGGSLCGGRLTGLVESHEPGSYTYTRADEILRCPWHGWEFDLRTGRSEAVPKQYRARTFKVDVAHGSELASTPLALETYPVSVEQDYIVLTMPGGAS